MLAIRCHMHHYTTTRPALLHWPSEITLHKIQNLLCLIKATFSIEAVNWDLLNCLSTVRNLTLRRCQLSNAAFNCLSSMMQLTTLLFSMSYPIKGVIDCDCADNLSMLTSLASLYGRFVTRYGHGIPQELSMWVTTLP